MNYRQLLMDHFKTRQCRFADSMVDRSGHVTQGCSENAVVGASPAGDVCTFGDEVICPVAQAAKARVDQPYLKESCYGTN